jgi:mannose-6-phosphate isomerase-like protein (cupin superfamily)
MTTAPTPPAASIESLARALVSGLGEGETLEAFGDRLIVKVDGARSEGRFALFEGVTPAGIGPPLHLHHREDETFFIIEGRCEFQIGDARRTVEAGSVVFAPRGVAHAFRNVGTSDLRMYILTSPSGFEDFFREAADVFKKGPPDMETAAALGSKYGIDLLGPPLGD